MFFSSILPSIFFTSGVVALAREAKTRILPDLAHHVFNFPQYTFEKGVCTLNTGYPLALFCVSRISVTAIKERKISFEILIWGVFAAACLQMGPFSLTEKITKLPSSLYTLGLTKVVGIIFCLFAADQFSKDAWDGKTSVTHQGTARREISYRERVFSLAAAIGLIFSASSIGSR